MSWLNGRPDKPVILHIDDEPAMVVFVREGLMDIGAEFVSASSVEEGLRAAEKFKPCLILMDVRMPELDGVQGCALVRANPALKDIPVLMLTSMDRPKDVDRALSTGATSYITKPIQLARLRQKILTLVRIPKV